MSEEHKEKIEDELRTLTGTLHEQCLDTGLITIEQWNKRIAPKLMRLSNVIQGLLPTSPTARTYEIWEDVTQPNHE
jgi:hypothetical protein